MVLDRFLKPKWQHPNPQVRKRALLELADDAADALSYVAEHDDNAELRQLAVRRIGDLELLVRASVNDSDAEVRAAANERFRQLLAGLREDSPALSMRLERVSADMDAELLEFLAVHGKEAALRQAAIAHVQRQSVLGDAALGDADADNRLRALERIEQRSTLERVTRDSRKHDKQLHRLAQEKLEALVAELERPQRVREQAQTIFASVRTLGRSGRWDHDRERLGELEQQWSDIAAEVDAESAQRYRDARDAFLRAHDEHVATERRLAPLRAVQQALFAELQELEATGNDPTPGASMDKLAETLTSIGERWRELDQLPQPEQEQVDARFADKHGALIQQLALLRQQGRARQALHDICAQAEHLQAQDKPLRDEQLQKLEQRWRERPHADEASAELESLHRRYESIHSRLRERLLQEQTEREELGQILPAKLNELEAALKSGESRHAVPLHGEISAKLDRLQLLEPRSHRVHKLQNHLQRLRPQVRELQGWRRWGTNQAREHLCEQVEQLVGSEEDPNALAKRIHALQEEWKNLDRSGGPATRPLWERFQESCHRAYAPCTQYFEQQAQQRHDNQARKEALCQELESFLASTDWDDVDWKAVVGRVRKAQHAWHELGPVDRKRRRALDRRFKAVMDGFEQHLAPERERNLHERRALIGQISALQDMANTAAAIEQCKLLRQQWHTTVPARRKDEKKIWDEFQAACDAIFGRRRTESEERQKAQRDNLTHKQRICDEIESLCQVNSEHVEAAQRQVHKLQGEWQAIGHVPKAAAAGMDKRYRAALKGFRDHQSKLRHHAENQALERLRAKARLCEEVERLAEQGQHAGPALAELIKRWQDLEALANGDAERGLQSRFTTAHAQIESGQALTARELERNQGALEQMCLQMELLAGVDSPAEFKEARMRYQVERLTQALQQGRTNAEDEARDLVSQWWLIGPAPASLRESLNNRFEQAAQAFFARPPQH